MKVLEAFFSWLIALGWRSGARRGDVSGTGNIECGRTYAQEERNSDGAIARSNNQPWLVALSYRFEFFGLWRSDSFLCGGALVHEKYILTAAHCVDRPWYMKLFGGFVVKLEMRNLNATSNRVERRIKKTIIHEHYEESSGPRLELINDIALLKLAEPVIFTPRIVPICLPKYEKNFAGVSAYLYGWGTNLTEGSSVPEPAPLRRTDFRIVPHGAMDASRGTHTPITEFLALHQRGKSSICAGDSGSPMISEEDGRATIIGIASWAQLCDPHPGSLSASTNVTNYVRWIEANINEPESILEYFGVFH